MRSDALWHEKVRSIVQNTDEYRRGKDAKE